MKVGILTFHRAINAGACLQAYALQETLIELGFDAYIVDYTPMYIEKPYKSIRSLNPLHPRGCIYELLSAQYRFKRKKRYNSFFENYYRIIPFEDIHSCDALILGSDQIWNPSITGGNFDPVLFGCINNANINRVVSYAASTMNVEKFSKDQVHEFGKLLTNIDTISIRETSLGQFISHQFSIPSYLVLDPTLISNAAIYDKMFNKDTNTEPYLLFYEVWHNDEIENKARRIAKERGLKFVGVCGADITYPKNDVLQVYSPSDLVTLIKRSNHVITSSFHGTAFSLIFKKQFNIICEEPNQAVRMQELLRIFKRPDLFSYKSNPVSTIEIDYEAIDSILDKIRQDSKQFIENSLRYK